MHLEADNSKISPQCACHKELFCCIACAHTLTSHDQSQVDTLKLRHPRCLFSCCIDSLRLLTSYVARDSSTKHEGTSTISTFCFSFQGHWEVFGNALIKLMLTIWLIQWMNWLLKHIVLIVALSRLLFANVFIFEYTHHMSCNKTTLGIFCTFIKPLQVEPVNSSQGYEVYWTDVVHRTLR